VERLLMITNSAAGTADAEAVDEALAVLRGRGLDVEVVATADAGELDAVLDRRDDRRLVIAGGDGSLHAVAAALHRREETAHTTLGLIPLGTGNDFARGVGLPLEPAPAAEIVATAAAQPVDLLVDEGDGVVVNAVHVGVGADAGRAAEPWKARLGKVGYVVGAVIAGFTTDGHRLRVEVDGQVVATGRRRVLQVGVGNGSFVGGGTELAPEADPTDGHADVLMSFAVSPLDRLRYAIRLRRGTHDERHDVRLVEATTVRISGEPFWTNADGELAGPFTDKTWTLVPGALRMTLPSRSRGHPSR
jgi:diacylglycerol kinase (ATP)